MSDEIVYRYDETKDPAYVAPSEGNETPEWQRTYVTGVPLCDLRQADFDNLAKWQRKAVAGAAFFVAVGAVAETPDDDETPAAAQSTTTSRRKPKSEA